MQILIWTLIALVALGPHQDQQERSRTTTQEGTQKEPTSTRPSAPVYSRVPQKNHGHAAESYPGTPPCGTRGANCPAPTNPTHRENHTGQNVAIGVGAGIFAGILINGLAHASEPVNRLSNNGPQFPGTVHMSLFQVTGFVKGGWPLAIDYESIAPTYAVLTIVAPDAQTYSVLLPTDQTARRSVIIQLPLSLGTGLKIANFTIRSTVTDTDLGLRYFRIYGFGCGPRAVGSVAIDQLKFTPQTITAAQSDTHFSFHTHANFDRMKAEFMQVSLVDRCLEGEIFDNKKIDRRLQENEYWNDKWNGKKAHPGQIQFRVRGWMTADAGGDWVSAFSPDLVLKQ